MAKVLLFNIEGEKRTKIKLLLLKLRIAACDVPPGDFGRSIGALAGRKDSIDEQEETAEPFSEEMLVMDSLDAAQFHGLLDGMMRQGAKVALKAVVTEQNLGWSAARLHSELAAEREAMKNGDARSVHGG